MQKAKEQKMHLTMPNNLEHVIDILASTAVENRYKRASKAIENKLYKQADGWMDSAKDWWNHSLVPTVQSTIGTRPSKYLGYGLAGAGIGAGIGLGSNMFSKRRRDSALSSMLLGGLLGGATGGFGSLAIDKFDDLRNATKAVTPADALKAQTKIDTDVTHENHMQPYSQALDRYAHDYQYNPHNMRDIARYVGQNPGNQDAAYRAWLDKTTMPANLNTPYANFSMKADNPMTAKLPFLERSIGGISPDKLRTATTPEAQKALVDEVMKSYETNNPIKRPMPLVDDPNHTTDWVREDLQSELKGLLSKANDKTRSYRFAQPKTDEERKAIYGLLGDWAQQGKRLSGGFSTGRNDAESMFHNMGEQIQGGGLGDVGGKARAVLTPVQMTGLGNLTGFGRSSDGILPQLQKNWQPTGNVGDYWNSPKYKHILENGFNPVELNDLHRQSPEYQDSYMNEMVREGRLDATGTPWTYDRLKQELPAYIHESIENSKTNSLAQQVSGLMPDLSKTTTGLGPTGDIYLAGGTPDLLGSGIMALRNKMTGFNPQNVLRALDNLKANPHNKNIPDLPEDAIKYLREYADTPQPRSLFRWGDSPASRLRNLRNVTDTGIKNPKMLEPDFQTLKNVVNKAQQSINDHGSAAVLPNGLTHEQVPLLAQKLNSLNAQMDEPYLQQALKDLKLGTPHDSEGLPKNNSIAQPAKYDPEVLRQNLLDHLSNSPHVRGQQSLANIPADQLERSLLAPLAKSEHVSDLAIPGLSVPGQKGGPPLEYKMNVNQLRALRGKPTSAAIPELTPEMIAALGRPHASGRDLAELAAEAGRPAWYKRPYAEGAFGFRRVPRAAWYLLPALLTHYGIQSGMQTPNTTEQALGQVNGK
jgi:hypothetical protein